MNFSSKPNLSIIMLVFAAYFSLPDNFVTQAQTSKQPISSSDEVNKDVDLAFWASIKDSDNPDEFKAYLDQFPKGSFRVLAKLRLKRLSSATTNQANERAPVPDDTNDEIVHAEDKKEKADSEVPYIEGLEGDRPSFHIEVKNATSGDIKFADGDTGVRVEKSFSFGSAYSAGIRSGDVILLLNEQPVTGIRQFVDAIKRFNYTSIPTVTFYDKSEDNYKQVSLSVGHFLGTPEYYFRNGTGENLLEAAKFMASYLTVLQPQSSANSQRARNYLERAIDAGDGEAARTLGYYLRDGSAGFGKDIDAARNSFKKGAELGDIDSSFEHAMLKWRHPKNESDDLRETRAIFSRIKDVYPNAKANLALMFSNGTGGPQDITLAEKYASQAASEGVLEAYHTLGTIHSGHLAEQGWPKNIQTEWSNYSKCVDGLALCKAELGVLHVRGEHEEANRRTGIALLREAAVEQNKEAEQWLTGQNISIYDPFEVQTHLQELGYPVGGIDGKIGCKTRTAVATFRRDYKLKAGDQIDVQLVRDLRQVIKLIEQQTTVAKRTVWKPRQGLIEKLRAEREARELKAVSPDLFEGLGNLEELDQ